MVVLSPMQRHVLQEIVRCVRRDGVLPTVRKLCAAFEKRSPATMHQHVEALRRKGYVRPHDLRSGVVVVYDPLNKVELPARLNPKGAWKT